MNKDLQLPRGAQDDTTTRATHNVNKNNSLYSRATAQPQRFHDTMIWLSAHLLVVVILLLIVGIAGEPVQTTSSSSSSSFNMTAVITKTNTKGNVTAQLAAADFMANNGVVVHKIDHVLLPEFWNRNHMDLASCCECSIYFTILDKLKLTRTITEQKYPLTIFAPTNAAWMAAFGDISRSILNDNDDEFMMCMSENDLKKMIDVLFNHIFYGVHPMLVSSLSFTAAPGRTATPLPGLLFYDNGGNAQQPTEISATIVRSNLLAKNGMVHVIDRVLSERFVYVDYIWKNKAMAFANNNMETTSTATMATNLRRKTTATQTTTATNLDNKNVKNVIMGESDLSTLANALSTAGLADVLGSNDGKYYTLFAPTNEAFAALDQEYWKTLLTPPWILHLTNLLSYHISYPTANLVVVSDFVDEMSMTMLNNETIALPVD